MDIGVDLDMGMDMDIFLLFRFVQSCLWIFRGYIETLKQSVSILKRNNRNKRLVSDSAETSFGSSFGNLETKPISLDTLGSEHPIIMLCGGQKK
jgi:hypothetical protein